MDERAGDSCDIAQSQCQIHSLFIDDYGSANEPAMIRERWPSRAEGWFRALREVEFVT